MKNESIVYPLVGGGKRPSNGLKIRLLFKLYKLPVIHKLVRKLLLKALGLPLSSSINQGFYCSAPLLELGEAAGLGISH